MTTPQVVDATNSPKPSRVVHRSRIRRSIAGATLVGLGAVGGSYAAAATGAFASTHSPGHSTTTKPAIPLAGRLKPPGAPLPMSGTVAAVGTSSVTIGTTTYAVDSNSDIDKNGESTLSALSVGDAVRFSIVTTNGVVAIDKLHAGSEALDRPPGGPMGAGPLALSDTGTVTAVGSSSVTIGATTYAVDTNSDIDKNGESTLGALSVGDVVHFSTVTTNGVVTIDKLHAGSEALDRPAGPPNGVPPAGA